VLLFYVTILLSVLSFLQLSLPDFSHYFSTMQASHRQVLTVRVAVVRI